jgi:transcriptional/translational regulatory protein YebC/TACO1
VHRAVEARGLKPLAARIGMIPQNTIALGEDKAPQMLKMMEKLEDNDDVQNVYANFDISDEMMEKLS